MLYMITDVESFRNNVPWDPPEDKPNAFAPLPCHGIAAIGGLTIEIPSGKKENEKNRCTFLGTFGTIGNESTERSRIVEFIKYYRKNNPTLVTYNGRHFDIPVIWMRAMHFGLPIPEFFRKDFSYRYSTDPNFDLYDSMANFGASPPGTMAQVCGIIGLPGKMGIDGSEVHDLFRIGEYKKIHSYVQCDVIEEALILVRYLHVRGEISAVVANNLIHSIRSKAIDTGDEMVERLIGLIDFNALEVPYNVLGAKTNYDNESDPDIPF